MWRAKYLSHRLSNEPSRLHRWLDETCDRLRTERGRKVSVVAPRGSAKTTTGTIAYALYAACYADEPYSLIVSDTGGQAKQLLANVRAECESNEPLRRDFPGVAGPGPVWRDAEVTLPNGCTIGALGTGGKIRGRLKVRRPTLILVDDPQNAEHITSAVQRERSWRWFSQDVEYAGEPSTNFLVLGTALHRDCIVCRLQTQPGWEAHLFRGVEAWPARMDLWREWESVLFRHDDPDREAKARAFYEERRAEMDDGHAVLWPHRFPLYDLMLKRASTGHTAFEFEQQGNPVDPSACEWPPEYFEHAAFWFEAWPDELQVKVLHLDPSKGRQDKPGDYQAYVRYGRTKDGVEYVEADLRRQDTAAMTDTGVEHILGWKPDAFSVEGEAFQELLKPIFLAAFKARGVECPIKLTHQGGTDKDVRIRRLTPPLAQRRMRFKAGSPGTQLLVQQLRDFPNGDYRDGPDALEQARRVAIEMTKGRA